MKSDMLVVVFSPRATTQSRRLCQTLVRELESHGLPAVSCEDPAEVYRNIGQCIERDSRMATQVVLLGAAPQNHAVAAYLRTVFPGTVVLLVYGMGTEAELISYFQQGIDAWAPAHAPVALLVSMLLSLVRRQSSWRAKGNGVKQTVMSGTWTLDEQGWKLINPLGQGIALTTSERAFLVTLLSAPDQRATHEELIAAINGIRQSELGPKAHTE